MLHPLWPELRRSERPAPAPPGAEAELSEPTVAAVAHRALAELSPAAAAGLRRLLTRQPARPFVQRLAAGLVAIAQSPQLLAAPGLVAQLAGVLVEAGLQPFPGAGRRVADAIALPARRRGRAFPRGRPDSGLADPADHASCAAPERGAPALPRARCRRCRRSTPRAERRTARPRPPSNRGTSGAAKAPGCSCWSVRWHGSASPGWLERRPEVAAGGFAWALFADIARRMRVPEDDPVWEYLPEAPPDANAAGRDAWRVGLDGWLRRATGCKLAGIVRRAGWLSGDETAVAVRFPLAAADIRLRRLALDVDPGWVDWLGLSLTYLYRDRIGS